MKRYLNRWSALVVWAAVIGGLWIALVPGVLSASSLVMLALAGPALVIVAFSVRSAGAPEQSVRQARVEEDSAATTVRGGK
jgi:O-antigen ligase